MMTILADTVKFMQTTFDLYMTKISPETIDAILPQTQCGLCGYGGCLPYAKALVIENAEINLCPPGGVEGLRKIAALLDRNPSPFEEQMAAETKPTLRAIIREAECIGCTKCIQACPVDAIMGAAKSMHTILTVECNGCELCLEPCPVDCIDMVEIPFQPITPTDSAHYRAQHMAKQRRTANRASTQFAQVESTSIDAKKSFIEAALARAKSK
jgi:electron transport complex protein RnfB